MQAGEVVPQAEMDKILLLNKQNLQNTALFNYIDLQFTEQTDELSAEVPRAVNLQITLKERWYFWPSPFFDLIDRNFNVWWNQFDADLSRTNYGVLLVQENLTGNNDRLKTSLQLGYIRRIQFEYRLPYFDKKRIFGVKPLFKYSENREVAIRSVDNLQEFFRLDDNSIIQKNTEIGLTISRRKSIYINTEASVSWNKYVLDPMILIENPLYLPASAENDAVSFFRFGISTELDYRDIDAYPLKGFLFKTEFTQTGIGISSKALQSRWDNNFVWFQPLNQRWFALFGLQTRLTLADDPYYLFYQGLGYGDDNVRAHEFYLIDGQHYVLGRTALRYHLGGFQIQNPITNLDQFEDIPVAFYLKGTAEAAYVDDPFFADSNLLANRWLNGVGVGLDVVTFYDLVLSIEYGINTIGEQGIKLQFNFEY